MKEGDCQPAVIPLTPDAESLHPSKVLLGRGAIRVFLVGMRSFVVGVISTRDYHASPPYLLPPLSL